MPRTRVKICGVCRVEDAVAAALLGADAVGLVFHLPSPRNVTIELAEQIIAAIPAFVTPVGLFVDATPNDVARVVRRLHLSCVQLHGHETPETAAEVAAETGATLLKALRVERTHLPLDLALWREAISRLPLTQLKGLVLETAGAAPGGSGQANDWEAVRSFQDSSAFEALPPLIAAGGLTPENVAGVIRAIRPWAVDVSSGVETVRGVKSEKMIRAFVEAVREADGI